MFYQQFQKHELNNYYLSPIAYTAGQILNLASNTTFVNNHGGTDYAFMQYNINNSYYKKLQCTKVQDTIQFIYKY